MVIKYANFLEDQTIMDVAFMRCVQCKGIWFNSVVLAQIRELKTSLSFRPNLSRTF